LQEKKAEYTEKMRNRIAMIHKERGGKEGIRGGQAMGGDAYQEMAAKHWSKGIGTSPKKKILECFG
jgi:hypothetical protein